jgi:5-methylcytosine-specific restriction endonuclease McrA
MCLLCKNPNILEELLERRSSNPDVKSLCNSHSEEYVILNKLRSKERARDYLRQKQKEWYEANKEKHNQQSKQWAKDNPEKRKEIVKRCADKHPEYKKTIRTNRRALEAKAEGKYTTREWLDLCTKYNYKCLARGKDEKLTKDHIVPLSNGGTNYISNIQPLCHSCNTSKHDNIIDYR